MEGNHVIDVNPERYQEDIGEDDAKANKDHRVVSVGTKKPTINGDVAQKLDSDTAAVKNPMNIPTDISFKTNGEKLKNLACSSLKTLKMKLIGKIDELINIRRVTTVTSSAMIREKHDFNEQPNCMVAKKLVTFNGSKPTDMLTDCSRLMNDVIGLDIYKRLISFPWNPGVSLCWICCYATMYITLQMLFQSEECYRVTLQPPEPYKVMDNFCKNQKICEIPDSSNLVLTENQSGQ